METVSREVPAENVFHDHLDVCQQCREQPFNLCTIGGIALQAQVRSGKPGLLDSFGLHHAADRAREESKQDDPLMQMLRHINGQLKDHPRPPEPAIPLEITNLMETLTRIRKTKT